MAKRRIKKPVRKNKSDYPGEMSFRKALGMNPTYYQEGGKLYYQENTGQLPPSTGFNFSGYLDGNQGLIPDYNNIPTKSHISNILFNTPLPVVKPADKPKKSDVLDLDNSLDYLVNTRGGTRDLWGRMADTIGYHESAHTMNPLQKQIGGGPGRGIFQFEAPSLVTAQNRYKRIASKLNLKTDPEILNAKSALELSPEQQYSLFLINLSESKAKLKDYADNKLPLVDLWLQGHKNKEAITDRESFRTSVQKAKKESIKNGYSTLKEFGGKLYYQEDIGELPIITKDPNDPRIKEYELRKKLYESNVYPPEGVTMYSFDEYKPDAYTLYTPRDTKKEEYLGYDSWALSRMNQGNSDFVDIDSNKRVTPKIKPSKFYDAIIRKYIDDPANQNYIQNSFKNYVLDPNSNILSYTDKPDKSFLLDPENSAKVFNRGLFFDTSNKLCADGHCSNVVTSTFGVPIYDPPGRPVVYDNIGSISKEWGRNWKSTESGKGAPPRPGMNTSNANTVNPDDFGYYYQIRFNDGKSKILTPEEYEQYKTTEEYINHENIINAEKQRQQRLRDERRNRISSRKLGGSLPRAQMLGGKLRYARGGSLTSAQDTAQAADLNKDVMRKDVKKASVGEDFLAGAYGLWEGTLDTLTFGLTDELTDAGFKGLQAAAGHDINSDEAKRQAGIAGWGNVAGAVTGAIINPGAIGSAAEEGLEGIGSGIEGIDPNSGIATGIGTALKGMGSSKMLSGLNDKDKIPQGMQGFSKLFMARNGGRFRYGYQGGGHMVNQNMGLTEIDGPSHEDGGVTLPNSGGRPDVEVEGPETIYTPENYVMSEKMKASKEALEYAGITGKAASRLAGKSYADLSKSIKSKAGDKLRPADPLSKKMLDKEMKRLMKAHEYDREAKRMKDEAMRSQMMGGSNIVAETPEERAGGYNMYPNAQSIAFPGSGPTSVVPTYNNDPIMVTGADGSQQMLTDEPIETEAPFIEEKMAQGGKMIKRADGSYSRRGLWDNIRANRGSGKKPTKQMLEQEAKIKAKMQVGGRLDPLALTKTIFNPNDESTVENVMEVFDPSGISSWDDVYKSYQESGMSPATQLEIFGALPLLGKVGKLGKAIQRTIDLSKLGRSGSRFGKMDRNEQVLKSVLGTGLFVSPYVGRLTDAAQAVQQYPKAPLLPSYKAEGGSFDNPGFRALPGYVQAKIKSNMALGGYMGDYIDEDDTIEYGSGGYTVRRSNDRKGKTHVVTGPDGTKKYFGDPKLGERGKSKYGKKGFYARHKKNLAKNPYFRAYARATWEDGGYMNMLDSNVDMVDMETPMYEYGGSMMYGQGGGIHIDPSKRGTFKAQASRMGMGVQQAARTILNAPEGKYSPAMRKKANFARNFAKADGGYMYQMGGEMMPEEMMAAEQQAAMQQGQQPQGGGQEQIIQAIVQMLQQGLQPEQIVGELVKMGVPQEAAIQAVQMVMQQVQQSQGMQQQQQAAPPVEQGMMGQQQAAPATMRGGGRMYQMGGSLADNYLDQVNQYPVLKRGGGKLYYEQSNGVLPAGSQTAISKKDLLPIPQTTSQPSLPSLMNNEVELTGLKAPQISPELVYKTFPVGKPKPKSAPPLDPYESPMGNYIAGGVGSMLGPLANAAAAAFAPDPTYTAAPKLGRYDYTPVALQRAQANQAMANTREAIRMGAPTQGSYLANVGVALPSAGANYGSQIAQTRDGINAQNIALANQEAQLRAAQAEKNALLKDQSISNRWKLGMEAAAGTGRNIQGFSRDLAAKRMQDMMVNQLRTGDFSVIGYENVNGTLIPKLAPTGLANYNDGTVTAPDGRRYKYNPDIKNYELIS